MKKILCIILLVLLVGCKEEPDHTTNVCDENGCIKCKSYDNYDHTKTEVKCTGTGEYAAMYADNVNGDPDGVVVEEILVEEDTGGE